jgi:hypothetical protein
MAYDTTTFDPRCQVTIVPVLNGFIVKHRDGWTICTTALDVTCLLQTLLPREANLLKQGRLPLNGD